MAKKKAKKSARPAAKKTAGRAVKRSAKKAKARKTAPRRRVAKRRTGVRVAARAAAPRKAAARKASKTAPKKRAPSKAGGRKRAIKPAPAKAAVKRAAPQGRKAVVSIANRRPPTLDRPRRRAVDAEADIVKGPPSSLNLDRSASAVRSGRAEFNQKLHDHTSSGPALTGGDVDANWADAETTGDEAPGGDNPTPDQGVVEDIGKSLGVTYEDDEELQGGDEIVARDKNRWELDPASKDDFEDTDE